MNRRYSAIAGSVVAMGALAVGTTTASARVPDEPDRDTTTVRIPAAPADVSDEQPTSDGGTGSGEVRTGSLQSGGAPSGSIRTDAIQVSASALGGAGIALSTLWLYRRRQHPANS